MTSKEMMIYGGVGAAGIGALAAYKASKLKSEGKTANDQAKLDSAKNYTMAAIVLIGGGLATAYYAGVYQPTLQLRA